MCSCSVVNLSWKLRSTLTIKVLAYMYIGIFIYKGFCFTLVMCKENGILALILTPKLTDSEWFHCNFDK